MTEITHGGSRCAGPILAAAAVGVLPSRRPRRTIGRARRPVAGPGGAPPAARPGSPGTGSTSSGPGLSGSLLSGSLLSGSLVSGTVLALLPVLAAASRALPAAGPGLLLVLSGLVLLAGAAVAARVRTVRSARAREIAVRVRAAVLAAADRELIRRTLDAERAAGVPAPAVTGARATPRRAGAGRAA